VEGHEIDGHDLPGAVARVDQEVLDLALFLFLEEIKVLAMRTNKARGIFWSKTAAKASLTCRRASVVMGRGIVFKTSTASPELIASRTCAAATGSRSKYFSMRGKKALFLPKFPLF
jgi:hypothetical protein